MSDKFPGSWRMVAMLCGVIIAAQAARAVLLQPVVARLSTEPEPVPVAMKASTASANLVSASAVEALGLVERYEASFTPELDARARLLAEQRGLPASRLPSSRSVFVLLAGRNLLVEPAALQADLPEGWEIVCGDQEPDYVCLTITSHINFMAANSDQLQRGRQRLGGGS